MGLGLKKYFKPKENLTEEEEYKILEEQGLKKNLNVDDVGKRKFRFQEFSAYAKESASKQSNSLKPKNWKSEAQRQQEEEEERERLRLEENQNLNGAGSQQSYQQQAQSQQPSYQDSYDPYADPYGQQQANGSHVQRTAVAAGAPSYHTVDQVYDPYAEHIAAPNQSQSQMQEQAYDPHAQQNEVIDEYEEPDFNDYQPQNGAQKQSKQFDPYANQDYDPYAEVQQQEVDSEEEEISRIVRHTKDVREATVKSSNNILGHLRHADDTATNTMGVLGAQREKMWTMESKLNELETQQRFTDNQITDLNHYKGSIFHVRTNNPFTRKKRAAAAEKKLMDQRASDRERDAQVNADLYKNQNVLASHMTDPGMQGEDYGEGTGKSDLANKYDYDRRVRDASKYLTEDHDEEDERMEVELSKNMDEASRLAQNLKKKAWVISNEIDNHNKKMKDVAEKVTKVDDKVVSQTNRIRGV